MRRCEDCKTEYEDYLYTCPNCGSDLSRPINQEKTTMAESSGEDPAHLKYMQSIAETTANENTSRRVFWVVAIMAIVVIGIIVALIAAYLSDPQRDIDKSAKEQYEIAIEYIDDNNYEAALKALDQVAPSWSDYDKVEKQRVKAVKGQLKLKLETYNAEKNYEAIITLIKSNISNIEDDNEIKDTYNNAVERYRSSVIEEANRYIVAKDYDNATKILTKATTLLGGDEAVDSKLFEVKKAQALILIKDFESKKDYESAIKYIRSNLDSLNNDAELKAELSRFEGLYRDKIIKDAETAYKKDGYASALSIINKGLNLMPDDSKLLSEKSAYEDCAPVDLTTLDYYTFEGNYYYSYGFDFYDSVTDVFGNTYSNAFFGLHGGGSQTYALDKKYNELTATIFVPEKSKGAVGEGSIIIYGDGKVLYRKSNISSSSRPFNIKVDISGITDLKIEMTARNGMNPCMCNVYLQKTR